MNPAELLTCLYDICKTFWEIRKALEEILKEAEGDKDWDVVHSAAMRALRQWDE